MADRGQDDHIWDSSGQITSTGSANAYVIATAEPITGYYQGMPPIRFKANFGNTGAATANVNGLGAVPLRKYGGATALASGDIVSGGIYTLSHDGTNFQVLELNAQAVGTADLVDDSVTNAKLANMAQATIKGRAVGAGTGDPQDLTATQATAILDAFTSALKGLVPASGGGTTTFLRADGTFAAPVGITAGTAQATTSGTAFDFTGLPAGLKRITVIFDGVSLSGADSLLVQIGDSGGVETTGYVASSARVTGANACGVVASGGIGFNVSPEVATAQLSGHVVITRVTGNIWSASHSMGSETGSTRSCFGGGTKTLSAELDRVRITRSGTDTFDAGQVNIMYE